MMTTTHGAVGAAMASVVVLLSPAFATAAAVGAVAGSLLPDVDLVVGEHRRTLHYPVLGWVVALPTLAWAALAPSPASVAVGFFFLGLAVHSAMDALGAGTEVRPWEATSDRGVYAHVPGTWLRARRWVRYDGAPEDLALCAFASLPPVVLFEGPIRWLIFGGLLVSVLYTAFRKRIPELEARLLD
jgi:hypothetical protein